METYESIKARLKKERDAAAAKGVDSGYINSFLSDAAKFVNAQKTALEGADWASSTNSGLNTARGDTLFDLTNRADLIGKYLDANQGTMNEKDYKKLRAALEQYRNQFNYIDYASGVNKKIYGQFATQQDYDQYLIDQKAAAEKRKILEQLDQVDKEYDRQWYAYNDVVRNGGIPGAAPVENERAKAQFENTQLTRQELLSQVTEQDRYAWEGLKMKEAAEKDKDFERYAKIGASVENPNVADVVLSQGMVGLLSGAVKPVNKVTYTRDNWDAYQKVSLENASKNPVYANLDASAYGLYDLAMYMTEDEVNTYNYYLGKDLENGTNQADQYLKYLEEELNGRKGTAIGQKLSVSPMYQLGYAAVAGLDQFGQGIKNLGAMFSWDRKGNYVPTSSAQVTGAIAREGLKNVSIPYYNWKTGQQENIMLGENSIGQAAYDAIQSGVNMLPSIIVSTAVGVLNPAAGAAVGGALLGASAAGNAYQEKIQAGWTQSEARSYGFMVGASEAALETVLGAVGSAAGGGLKGLLERINFKAAKKIGKVIEKAAKTAGGKIALSALGEGVEEGLQTVLESAFATVVKGEEFTVEMEEVLYSALLGAVMGAGFGAANPNTYRGNIQKITANEKAVLKAETDARVKAQEEKLGRELTAKEKSDIEKTVQAELEKGYISTDRIEEVLGGDSWQKYKEASDREQAVLKDLEGLYEGEELQRQQQAIRDNSVLAGMREELSRGVSESVKNDRFLHESYLEKGRRTEKFTADVSKYKGKQAQIVQKAIDSGVLNNTKRSHELVDLIAKIGADKDIDFDFVNNEKLKESGFALDGVTVNGYVNESGIAINISSQKALNSVVGHEITHVLEGTDLYNELTEWVKAYANIKEKDGYNNRLKQLISLYQNVEGYKGAEGMAKIHREAVADLVGDYLFTDEAFVKRLLQEKPGLFRKIWNEIKYLATVTSGTEEARRLAQLQRAFEKAYRNDSKSGFVDSFQISEPVEETKTLLAMHNLSEADLRSALDRGNLIMPSVAVAESANSKFGPITAVLSKETIDPAQDSANKLYGADAWTPNRNNLKKNPRFDTNKTETAISGIRKQLGDAADQLFNVTAQEYMDTMTANTGSIYAAYAQNLGMKTAYALEAGLIAEIPTKADGTVDTAKLKEALGKVLVNDTWGKYKKWLDSISDETVTSYDTATGDDILANMQAQPATAKPFQLTEDGKLTVPATEYAGIEDMRQNRGRLSRNADAAAKQTGQKLLQFAKGLGTDTTAAVKAINEGFGVRYDAKKIRESFSRNGVYLSNGQAQQLQALYKEAVELPTEYFEAKPGGKVDINQIGGFAVPVGTNPELIRELHDRGFDVREYDPNKEGSRAEVVNGFENMKFSLSKENADEKAEGWQIKGVDVLLQQKADKNGLVWENGVPFRKDLLELAKQQAEEDFQIAPPTPAEREAARVAAEKAAQSSAGQVTETPAKSQAAENIAPPTPAEREAARAAEEKTAKEKKTEPVAKSKPIIAKKDLRETMYTLFSVQEGQRSAVGEIIDRYADRLVKNGSLTEADRQDFFNRMYESGAVEMAAEDYLAEARSYLKGSRIYVPDSVIADFGDDWNAFRRQAFANGIYLSRTKTSDGHSVAGIDVWNQDLAGELPGLFDVDETDQRSILERIVQVAEEGKAERLSLSEYTARLANTENIAEAEFLDNMERQMDWALRTFAEKANLEIHLRDRTGKQIAKERQRYKESADRARERKQLSELQQKTLKQLQWLSKNRNRAPEELRSTWDAVLGDIDLFAVGAANEMRWSNKYNATWKDLAQMYKDAMKNDPNFLPSKELERIVSRIDGTKIEDMDFDALQELYKAAIGLRTEYYNRNNVIQDEQHRMFAEVYTDAKQEIESAPGEFKGKKPDKFFNMEQLSPMNVLERMAGWNPDSTFYSMAKQLERGERDTRAYTVKAKKMLQDFLVKNEKWVKKADGQGKDAIWYEIEVPELMELGMGNKPIFGDTVKVYMTPSQKVHMYLESKNMDNLRHMTGGRTFVDKALYSKGERKEAFAQGKTVRLAPETVKMIVSDLTKEEMALAKALDAYYNDFSKKEINKVSNILYGYDKAMGKNYAPIYTNQNYTKTEFGVFDGSAEGVGNMKGRQYAVNPSYNISALDAFERSVDQTARFYGMAIPTRNWTTLMNWRVKNNSTADVITHKWGKEGKDYIDNLITALQGGGSTETDAVSSWINKLQSNYISAVFGANPSIVLKQLGSVPMASAYLGIRNLPSPKQVANIDRELISKYTQDLDWRTMGYTTSETKHLKENPNWTQSNKAFRFVFGGDAIVAMDGWAASTLWPWAENKVRKEHPELAVGTKEQINAGESPFYQKVAAEFEEAVSRSQSVSDEIHQSTLRKSKNPLARAFTLFRSDSAQTYNTIRQKVGEARYYMRTGAKKEVVKSAKRAVGAAVLALSVNAVWGAGINFLAALWKNKGKQYRDEDDEMTIESVLKKAGMDAFGSVAGVISGGGELADLIGNLITGDPWYDIDTPGMAQLNDLVETVYKTGENMKDIVAGAIKVAQNGGNVSKYFEANLPSILGIVKDIAKDAATYIPGLPAGNLEAYLTGTMKWISPELGKQYDDAFGTGRKKLTEKQQEEFAESGMTIQEYWDYRDALGKLNKQAEKLDYINSMDVDEDTKYVLKWYLFDADKAAEEDPERFEWLENEIGYVEYRELDKDAQEKWSWAYNNQEEYEYMKKNGIRMEDVDVFTVTMTDFNSQKSAVAASLGGAAKYKEYMDEIGDVKGDQDEDGDTISGSVKKNVWAYIDELDLEDGQKYILFKLKYPKDTKYDQKIVNYLRGRKDITAAQRVDIFEELGIEK